MLNLLKDVAARVITPRFRALAHGEVTEKRPGDLVTIADQEAEQMITEALRESDPDALVVGEEAASVDATLLERLPGSAHAFTVDPVDGTKNFVNGSANHAVMVAELVDGTVTRSWIWQPEHKTSFVTERGHGVLRNGARLPALQPPAGLVDLHVLTSQPAWEGPLGRLTLTPSAWCCGVDYPWVAEGRVDGTLYSRSLPWDHAPGSLLVEEMGGILRHTDGSAYLPCQVGSQPLLAAANEEVWQAVAGQLRRLVF